MFMKTSVAIHLLLISNSLLADRPLCSQTPGGCVGNPPGHEVHNHQGQVGGDNNGHGEDKTATVPEPGPLVLLGLGLAGLLVARKLKI
jgi:hypothetical protein